VIDVQLASVQALIERALEEGNPAYCRYIRCSFCEPRMWSSRRLTRWSG